MTLSYGLNLDHGFLPVSDPLEKLPADWVAWEEIAHELPKLLVAEVTRNKLETMPLRKSVV